MSTFRIAMVGAGNRANAVHYPSFAGLDDVVFAGICDINPGRLKKTADTYNIPEDRRWGANILSYRDMLDSVKPDGVAVIGDPDVMYPIWRYCLEKGINLYVEKPLGLTLHQAMMLTELAREHSVITQCTLQRRTTPLTMRLRDECLQYGPITHALVRFYKNQIETRYDARDHMMDDTIHSIDAVRWACGDSKAVSVHSVTRRVGVRDINFISATIEFENGATGYLINSWSSGRRVFDIEMHAPGVCAEAEHEVGGRLYAGGDTAGVPFDAAEVAGGDALHIRTGVQLLARDFVDACREKRPAISSFDGALESMRIAETILAQATLRGD